MYVRVCMHVNLYIMYTTQRSGWVHVSTLLLPHVHTKTKDATLLPSVLWLSCAELDRHTLTTVNFHHVLTFDLECMCEWEIYA